MIVCYHKTRQTFYVIKSNKKADRKFLFSSKDISECCKFAGEDYKLSKSAITAIENRDPFLAEAARVATAYIIERTRPTRSDEASDAGRETPATDIATPDASRRTDTEDK